MDREGSTPLLAAGEVIASTYTIVTELARTDTGAVFGAHDEVLDRPVAVKLAWTTAESDALTQEARRCAAVRDPCAVQVHGTGTHEGRLYAVAERVPGRLLQAELEAHLAPELYLPRLRTLIAAVARAHECGIAVGDISGSTVLVGPEGRLVLGRLSLSQVPAFGPHGQILAPEVIKGEVEAGNAAAAEAIDLYGLGCIAVELACGSPPFADDDREVELRGHASEPPPRIADLRPDLPSELSDLVDWLLAKQPAARPRSAKDVLAQVDAISERQGGSTRSVRVLVVDDDTPRARWMWSLARRAHASAIVETASEGSDAGHKLNRDQPDLVFIDAELRGVMNAIELIMYARGLPSASESQLVLIGDVSERDRALIPEVQCMADDAALPGAILDRVRAAAADKPRARRPHSTVSG